MGSGALTGADEESSFDCDVSRHQGCDVISSAVDFLAMVDILNEIECGILRNGVFENSREDIGIHEDQGNKGASGTVARGVSLAFHELIQEVERVPDQLLKRVFSNRRKL